MTGKGKGTKRKVENGERRAKTRSVKARQANEQAKQKVANPTKLTVQCSRKTRAAPQAQPSYKGNRPNARKLSNVRKPDESEELNIDIRNLNDEIKSNLSTESARLDRNTNMFDNEENSKIDQHTLHSTDMYKTPDSSELRPQLSPVPPLPDSQDGYRGGSHGNGITEDFAEDARRLDASIMKKITPDDRLKGSKALSMTNNPDKKGTGKDSSPNMAGQPRNNDVGQTVDDNVIDSVWLRTTY